MWAAQAAEPSTQDPSLDPAMLNQRHAQPRLEPRLKDGKVMSLDEGLLRPHQLRRLLQIKKNHKHWH